MNDTTRRMSRLMRAQAFAAPWYMRAWDCLFDRMTVNGWEAL